MGLKGGEKRGWNSAHLVAAAAGYISITGANFIHQSKSQFIIYLLCVMGDILFNPTGEVFFSAIFHFVGFKFCISDYNCTRGNSSTRGIGTSNTKQQQHRRGKQFYFYSRGHWSAKYTTTKGHRKQRGRRDSRNQIMEWYCRYFDNAFVFSQTDSCYFKKRLSFRIRDYKLCWL